MKILRFFFLLILTLLIWLAIRQYFLCPQFSFIAGKPFSGNMLYNPYSTMDSGKWVKCNFHAHTNAWNTLTNGKGTAEDVRKAYDSLGYAVHCISDYSKINDVARYEKNYIPAYEHGYNVMKTHQLVLGSNKVTWLDYLFPQTLSNKQDILNKLSHDKSKVVILNHPAVRNGYTEDDLKYLTNYQCIEVLNPAAYSYSYWDAALSAGKPAFITGNDDLHNVFDSHSIGRYCTWVNVSSVIKEDVIDALRKGHGYGMLIADLPDETNEERIKRLKNDLPYLKSFRLINDTIELEVSKPARQILFIGQTGKPLSGNTEAAAASYAIRPQDNYVRTVISFGDGTEIFLNSVFRYKKVPFATDASTAPRINQLKTILFGISGLLVLLIWCLYLIKFVFAGIHKRKKKYHATGASS